MKMSAHSSNGIEVRIPTILRPFTAGAKTVTAHGATLRDLIADLGKQYNGLDERLIENGALLRFINVYVNDEDVRFIGGLDLALSAGDSVTILPAVAGGADHSGAI
jgi:molybdopterin converting factor small subunit